jgi:MerR family mercuric resistance operon transcriptional regulator
MRIGDLAARAGVNIQTLRFYERKGILPQPPRTTSGYRSYSESDLNSVLFVRRCQLVGFTLKEICQLAKLHSEDCGPQARRSAEARRGIQTIARERLRIIDEQIESLRGMRSQLLGLLNETNGEPDPVCPFRKAE